MRPFTFNPGPRLLAGPDQAQALAEKLPEGACLFVTDRELSRLGLALLRGDPCDARSRRLRCGRSGSVQDDAAGGNRGGATSRRVTNALMLRHVLAHNLEAARDHYAELAEIIDPDCEGLGSQARAALLIEHLDGLERKSGLALRLRDYGIAFGEAPLLAQEAMKQTRLLVNNPCEIHEDAAQRL